MSMSASPSTPSPAGDDRNLVPANETSALTFEDKLQLFWDRNRVLIIGFCIAVVLAILAKGAWDYFARQQEREIQSAYAAATSTEQLKSFSAEHSDHPLGGIAQLRIADEAFAAGKSAEAIAGYEKAIGMIEEGPLAARATLGLAIAKAQAGNTAEATAALKKIVDDASQFKAIRAEAAYHLTSMAVGAGNATEAQAYVDQLNQIDPMGAWAQRAIMLRATLPATAPATSAPEASTSTPEATTPAAGEANEDTGVKLNLPGN